MMCAMYTRCLFPQFLNSVLWHTQMMGMQGSPALHLLLICIHLLLLCMQRMGMQGPTSDVSTVYTDTVTVLLHGVWWYIPIMGMQGSPALHRLLVRLLE
jgi:hypothetical protein